MSDTSETSDLYEITSLEGDVAITARNIRLYGSDVMSESGEAADTQGKTSQVSAVAGKLNLTADSLAITCTKSIKIAVGGNTISIDRNGIKLSSCKYTYTTGPFNANIQLDSLSGVTISGMSCSMKGYLSSTVTDGMGATLKAGYGAAGINGTEVALSTTSPYNSLLNFIQFSGDFVADAFSAFEKETSKTNLVLVSWDSLFTLDRTLNRFKKAAAANTAWGWISVILDAVNTAIDMSVAVITSSDALTKKSLMTSSVGDISLRDLLRILATITKASLAISTIFPLLCASLATKKFSRSSTLQLQMSDTKLNSAHVEVVTLDDVHANAPAAAVSPPLTGDLIVDAIASLTSKILALLASRISRRSVAGSNNLNASEENTDLVQNDASAEQQNAAVVREENNGTGNHLTGVGNDASATTSEQHASQQEIDGVDTHAGSVKQVSDAMNIE